MGMLNTAFNGATAHYSRRTAYASEASADVLQGLAAAQRRRDLRARGLIDDRSTPGEVAAVEHRLAVQMHARMQLAGQRTGSPYLEAMRIGAGPVLLALVIIVWMVGAGAGAAAFGKGLVVMAVVLAPAVFVFAVTYHRVQRRAAAAAACGWDDSEVCTWCGSAEPHLVDGEDEHPRVAHAAEIAAAPRI